MSNDAHRFDNRPADAGFGSATGIPASTLTGRSGGDFDRDDGDIATGNSDHSLISSDRVTGTAVYNTDGDRLGSIDAVMIGKVSGQVAYAVLSFGGFLGIGERYHPLPWDSLTYDETLGGYRVDEDADSLKDAPNYSRDELDTLDYGTSGIADYYGVDTNAQPMRM